METPSLPTEKVVDLSPFKKMVVTIGTLPNAFIDSMTYYEALAYFVNYLEKTVIPAINQNGEATEELQNLFTELKKYVDDYFSSLDVQEEINTKLDQMSEDGTLASIINEKIFTELNNKIDDKADQSYVDNELDEIENNYLLKSDGKADHLGVGNLTYTSPSSWTSTVFSVRANRTSTQSEELVSAPSVFAPHSSKECAEYTGRDCVAEFIGIQGRNPYLYVYNDNNIVYTSNSVNYPENADISNIKVGMVIDTNHTPAYSGLITEIDTINHKFIVEDSWYQVGGSAGTPPSGYGYQIAGIKKLWAKNTNVTLNPLFPQRDAVGEEMGLINNLPSGTTKQIIGYDVVSLGSSNADIGYMARQGNDQSTRVEKGFVAHNCVEGLTVESDNDSEFAVVTKNQDGNLTNNRFFIRNNGAMTAPHLLNALISADGQIPNSTTSVWIFTPSTDINYTLPDLSTNRNYDERMYIFINRSNYKVNLSNGRVIEPFGSITWYTDHRWGWIRIANI